MQNIIWVGDPYFAGELSECGFKHICTLKPSGGLYSWNDLVTQAGFTPDLVVVADNGGAPFVLGMEEFPCLTIFYSVYSHVHAWHRLYAQGFDACIVSQGGDESNFIGPFLNKGMVWHMPPFAPSLPGKKEGESSEAAEKEYDCLYLADTSTPGSMEFADALASRLPGLAVKTGKPSQLYPKAKIVIHSIGLHPGLDFRMFEAMGAGACLVTPRVGHGLNKIFVDGEHLVLYMPNDAGDAAHHINLLLEHPELVQYISQKGVAAIDAAHRANHRAWTFTDHAFELATYDASAIIAKRKANAGAIRMHSLSVPYVLCSRQAQSWKRAAFMAAARGKFGLNGLNG